MIHSARPTLTPVATTMLTLYLFCFPKGVDIMCEKNDQYSALTVVK